MMTNKQKIKLERLRRRGLRVLEEYRRDPDSAEGHKKLAEASAIALAVQLLEHSADENP